MKRGFMSPSIYAQGENRLLELGGYVRRVAGEGKVFLVAGREDRQRVSHLLEEALRKEPFPVVHGDFSGRCTEGEIVWLAELCAQETCAAVVGLGGGSALDTAKAVAHELGLPVIIIPTIASTDAPCSAASVVYKDTGELSRYIALATPPEVVLVDTGIIARAPVRFLTAGMGDGLSTWFEARANVRAASGLGVSQAGQAIARRCYEVLLADAPAAKAACEAGRTDEALERVVEAVLLLSGLGFENGGLAAAHAVHNGLTLLPETRPYLHGEIVAFCTLVQLVLEQAPAAELEAVLGFSAGLGLPVTLGQIGLDGAEDGRLLPAAQAACSPDNPMGNMPFPVSPGDVLAALREADRLGRECLSRV
ncbi:glycerol dehydrogenase [Paenibacillus sp. YN15]|uniref:glycerol dehydrogenase n=1 Tax=Paenibacillus sp. YN15 TaxID=1742774 RepID=UPI000DCD4966|nr:glycerol dehydrogenase [Paenibacillus sp. YN15]RAV01459.1 glycerol dehydrogenase [Paenibacillus sp. YN15]